MITVAELLEGKRIEYPTQSRDATFRRAPKAKKPQGKSLKLPEE